MPGDSNDHGCRNLAARGQSQDGGQEVVSLGRPHLGARGHPPSTPAPFSPQI